MSTKCSAIQKVYPTTHVVMRQVRFKLVGGPAVRGYITGDTNQFVHLIYKLYGNWLVMHRKVGNAVRVYCSIPGKFLELGLGMGF